MSNDDTSVLVSDPGDCCCNVFHFGKCFALNHSLIAECTDMRNDTVASCYSIDDSSRQIDCFIGPCQSIQQEGGEGGADSHSSDWIPYYMILGPGIAIYVTGFIYLYYVLPKRRLLNYQKKESSAASAQDLKKALMKRPDLRGELTSPRDAIIVHTLALVGFCFTLFGCLMRWYIETMFSSIAIIVSLWLIEGGRLGMSVACTDHSSATKLPTIKANNIYLALEEPMRKLVLVFFCQCLLIWIYVQDIFEEGFLDFSKPMTFLDFFFGIFIQLIYLLLKSDLESYRYYLDYDLWWLFGYTFSSSMKKSSTITMSTEGIVDPHKVAIGEIRIRIMSSILVNGLGGMILRPLIPIQLAASKTGIEFILNALAAYYIIELDDIPHDTRRKLVIDNQNDSLPENEVWSDN